LRKTEQRYVKKSAEKTCKRTPGTVETDAVALAPMDKETLRDQISKQIHASAQEMVGATIQQVNDGHYQAMKYLFEMIGLFPAPAMQDAQQEDSLAGMLLNRLGMGEETLTEEPGNERAKAKASTGKHVK